MKTTALFLFLIVPAFCIAQVKPTPPVTKPTTPVKSTPTQVKANVKPKPMVLDTVISQDPENPSMKDFKVTDTTGSIREYGELLNGQKENVWRTYFDNHVLYTVQEYHEGKADGFGFIMAGDGQIMKESYSRKDILDGPQRTYNRNGKLRLEENYVNGKQVGYHKLYYPEGQLQEVGNMNANSKRDGVNRWYHSNGKPLVEYLYVNGDINGPSKSYYESGKIKAEGTFKDNLETGHWMEYMDTTGTIKQEGDYVAGKKNGIWKVYNTDGSLAKTQNYKDGAMIDEKEVKNKKK